MDSVTVMVAALKDEWQGFYERAAKPRRCIFCGGTRLWWNGWRHRTASLLIGEQVVYVDRVACRLVKCGTPGCSKSWTLRPPGLAPQRHYQLCVVAQALSAYLFDPQATLGQVARATGCARRSVGRWITWVAGIAPAGELLRHLVAASGTPQLPSLPEVASLALRARTCAHRSILRGAAQVLCLLEALGQALGFSPPGLRAIVEAVVDGRYQVTTYARPRILAFARRHLPLVVGTLPM